MYQEKCFACQSFPGFFSGFATVFFHGQINLENNFQNRINKPTFFQFRFVFLPTSRGPAKFPASDSKGNVADTTDSVKSIGGIYLDRPLEVFDISKTDQNKVESLFHHFFYDHRVKIE